MRSEEEIRKRLKHLEKIQDSENVRNTPTMLFTVIAEKRALRWVLEED